MLVLARDRLLLVNSMIDPELTLKVKKKQVKSAYPKTAMLLFSNFFKDFHPPFFQAVPPSLPTRYSGTCPQDRPSSAHSLSHKDTSGLLQELHYRSLRRQHGLAAFR